MKQLTYSLAVILLISIFVPTESIEASNGETYEVSATILHVRDEPANNASIVGLLHQGDKLTSFEEKYGWVQTYYSGKVAWVAKHHLIPTESVAQAETQGQDGNGTITVNASSVNIRSGPGLEFPVIAGTFAGETFKTLDQSGDWTKVSLSNGEPGWIASWLTSGSESKPSTEVKSVSETSKSSEKQATDGSLAGYSIVLDAGHGGKDPGAIGLDGSFEKDIVSSTTSTLASTLRAQGATVIETRTGDYFLTLDERASISNAYYTDVFISIHYNAFPVLSVQGLSTYYASNSSRALAQNVQNALVSAVPLNNRGIMQENFKVLRNTNAPSILLELGFITNPYDFSIVRTADYQAQVAEAVANGLRNYFDN